MSIQSIQRIARLRRVAAALRHAADERVMTLLGVDPSALSFSREALRWRSECVSPDPFGIAGCARASASPATAETQALSSRILRVQIPHAGRASEGGIPAATTPRAPLDERAARRSAVAGVDRRRVG